MQIVETDNARFFEDGEISGSSQTQNMIVEETMIELAMYFIPSNKLDPIAVETPNDIGQLPDHPHNNDTHIDEPISEVPLRRSHRERRSAIPDDYLVYQVESASDVGICKDPISYS